MNSKKKAKDHKGILKSEETVGVLDKEESEQEDEEEKEEVEETDESLEQITEEPIFSTEQDFSEFMFSSGVEPSTFSPPTILSGSEQPTETFTPQTLEDVERERPTPPTPTFEEPVSEEDYIKIKNEPQYIAGTSEEKIIRGMRRRGMTAESVDQLRTTQPHVFMEDWHEIGEERQRGMGDDLREYTITEVDTREEERGLPFERKRKYRTIK